MTNKFSRLTTTTGVRDALKGLGNHPAHLDLLDNFELDEWIDKVDAALGENAPPGIIDSVATKVGEIAFPGEPLTRRQKEQCFTAALGLIDRVARPELYSVQRKI